MDSLRLREMVRDDQSEVSELIYASINAWYGLRGMGQPFQGSPQVTEVFYQVYNGIGTSRCVVAENTRSSRLMGSCFYHPRHSHVGLGIMTVHPNYFGHGAGREMLKYICDFTDQEGYKALRLTQSALNLDSFSLYNRSGFVPYQAYQDMTLRVPDLGLKHPPPGLERVRQARLEDIPAMADLELCCPRGRLPLLHRELSRVLARFGLRKLSRNDRRVPRFLCPPGLQYAWTRSHADRGSGRASHLQ